MNSLKSVKSLELNLTSDEIKALIDKQTAELLECQKCGNYVKADGIKISIEKLKKQLSQVHLNSILNNHRKEKKRLQTSNQNELNQFMKIWEAKFENLNCQNDKLKKQLADKHFSQLEKVKIDLETQIPTKLKESSECLNYRKIQEQMIKQKKYSEAHQIQQKISELQAKENQAFKKQRQLKIQTALKAVLNKQKTEIEALNKKVQTSQKELAKQEKKELEKLKLKHVNSVKDLASQQEKQLLGQKGQIKSRVSVSMCRSRQKLSSVSKKLR